MADNAPPTSAAPPPRPPLALEPPFPIGDPGKPVILYDSKATITLEGKTFDAPCRLELDWLPRPRIRCVVPPHTPEPDVQSHFFSLFMRGPVEATLVLDDGTRIADASIGLGLIGSFDTDKPTYSLRGVVNDTVHRGSGVGARYALFLLPNFDQPSGDPIEVGRGVT